MSASPLVAILAVGESQQLSVSAQSLTGTPITDFDSVTYKFVTASDSLLLKLEKSGKVTGLARSTLPIHINITVFRHRVSRADRVILQVTANSIPGVELSIQPTGFDSAKLARGVVKTIIPRIQNPATLESVVNPVMQYRVHQEDEPRVTVFTQFLYVVIDGTSMQVKRQPMISPIPSLTMSQILPLTGEGSAWIIASVNAYGTLLRDSVLYTFTFPYTGTIESIKSSLAVTSAFADQSLIVQRGATVTFKNGIAATDPITMTYTFDDPTSATAATPAPTFGGATGNVTALKGQQATTRKFLTPGTYRWTAIASGGPAPWDGQSFSGTIIVK